jgi:hypothetical protein
MAPPTGRLNASSRPFVHIVSDFRHVVYSVIRERQVTGGKAAAALGTGFFVSPEIFITCDHVMNDSSDPHQAGDSYLLISDLTGKSGRVHRVDNAQIGKEIHLYPNLDLAVLRVATQPDQPFAALDYGDVIEGQEIGVVGYPVPQLTRDQTGNLEIDGLIYRAAKGHVSGRYTLTFDNNLKDVPLVEVNFQFVPGNSGGPIFAAETGRVVGFVKAFRWFRIREAVVTAVMNPLPAGISGQYIENMHAVYSLAIKLDLVRTTLESFGVVP